MLEARKITYRYPARPEPLFTDISISINPGEVVGIYGPSGRGKTTLARIMAGYISPDRGEVLVDSTRLPLRGHLPVQLLHQHPELSVNPRWKIRQILEEEVMPDEKLLSDLQIDQAWFNRYPHELSGGEIQRVTVARALGPGTRYIIADEITTMLDAITQGQIWQVLLRVGKKRNLGILTISHDNQLLDRVCDTVYRLSKTAGLQPG
ncbi:ABC transporter ATP-binding protein [Desulfolithobacter sp.]